MKHFFTALFILICLGVLAPTDAVAHSNHNKTPSVPVVLESISPPTPHKQMVSDEMDVSDFQPEDNHDEKFVFSWSEAFFSHLHNKMIHFPFALGLAGAIFLVLAIKRDSFEPTANSLLSTAAVFALIALITGKQQKEPFIGDPLENFMIWHEYLGTAVLALLLVSPVFYFKKAPGWRIAYAFILCSTLSITDFDPPPIISIGL